MAIEQMPFDDQTLVFKIGDKIFAVLSLDKPYLVLKATPEDIADSMEHFAVLLPPRYFDKRCWYHMQFDQASNETLLRSRIDISYSLVVASLPRKKRLELGL